MTITLNPNVKLGTGITHSLSAPATVRLAVSDEDIRRRFYELNGYGKWVISMQMSPLQLIVCDDDDNKYYRVPVELDGDDAFSFGGPIEVAVEYVDVTTAQGAALRASALMWTSRDKSVPGGVPDPRPDRGPTTPGPVNPTPEPARPQPAPVDPGLPDPRSPNPAKPPTPTPSPGGRSAAPISAAQAARQIHNAPVATRAGGPTEGEASIVDPTKIREALGLSPDASEEDVDAAFAAARQPEPAPVEPQPVAAGVAPTLPPRIPGRNTDNEAVLVDPQHLAELRAAAFKGEEAYNQMRQKEREEVLMGAIRAGKFPPARKPHYEKLWEVDPEGTRDTITALASNLVPVMPSGFRGTDADITEAELAYKGLYGER